MNAMQLNAGQGSIWQLQEWRHRSFASVLLAALCMVQGLVLTARLVALYLSISSSSLDTTVHALWVGNSCSK